MDGEIGQDRAFQPSSRVPAAKLIPKMSRRNFKRMLTPITASITGCDSAPFEIFMGNLRETVNGRGATGPTAIDSGPRP